jgi:hypothetical protein
MLLCKFCNKECKNNNSFRNHERCCPDNPNRNYKNGMTGKKGTNQYAKGVIMSNETKAKIGEASKKQIWSEDRKRYHSERMKLAVAANPNSYTSSNRGRTKEIVYNEIKFQGRWELEFYQFCESNSIQIVRSNEWFEYEWNGTRKYFPDFYLPEHDLYVEVKGYETERDHAKWSQFPNKLKVVKQKEIYAIRKGKFNWADSLAS